ncbi:glycosyltransferase family 4 protein [filamentous cyanobacterium LEGE 11480]|uniref:Glycosyltransferase family 4 protein n=1 Tax=Romeriopsis navalis LEGE 11480 TaxID=2777977 RepID=A0A928VRJ8_9CYAN|nr:glycosyltransferase family 4 protein [Romeriopsis navalis LEGE 11480]
MRLLFLSTPVGPLGSGLGGGVELTLKNLAIALSQQGHAITIVAPQTSVLPGFNLVEVPGNLQITAQSQTHDAAISLPSDAVLGHMWEYARQHQADYDLLVNFAYDWLPFYLTTFFQTPIAHLVSMGSLSEAMDVVTAQVAAHSPQSLGVHSMAQAETFSWAEQAHNVKNGFDLSQYDFCAEPENYLAWVGRIAPEKGLQDAVQAVEKAGVPLKIFGVVQDRDYWKQIQTNYPAAPIEYCGFVETDQLQAQLRRAKGLLMTPHWVEAFGNVAIEALACGVPVVAYARGGPAEIVRHGETGWLVEPDVVPALVNGIRDIEKIDRMACRWQTEAEYSLVAMSDRVEAWFADILAVVDAGE